MKRAFLQPALAQVPSSKHIQCIRADQRFIHSSRPIERQDIIASIRPLDVPALFTEKFRATGRTNLAMQIMTREIYTHLIWPT